MTTKPRRKATQKVPAKPTPIEATQVLAYRSRIAETRKQQPTAELAAQVRGAL